VVGEQRHRALARHHSRHPLNRLLNSTAATRHPR
jgi:hypothetical protein